MRKIKILHIQVFPKLSGVQKISLEIMRGLPNDKFEKWIVFSDSLDAGDKDECRLAFEKAGVKVVFLKSLKREICYHDYRAYKDLLSMCVSQKFDIVHTHSTKPGIIGRFAARAASVPCIIHTVHGLSFHKFINFPKWQFYWACEMFASFFCDRITIVNKFYTKYFKFFREKTSTIYNGIDYSTFESYNIDERPLLDTNKPKILFVGRLDDAKDPLTCLKVAQKVLEKKNEAIFTFVGNGKYYQDCKDFIVKNNLEENIILEGWKSDIENYYKEHDIFIMTSIYESFGLIFLEAGYYGLPVIATNVEGIPEVVKDKESGLLSSAKDINGLVNNLLYLINNPTDAKIMGQKGQVRVQSLFSSQKMVEQYMSLYINSINVR